jgi:glycosyltransferase involved in cell wall biosynthesis
LRPLVSILIPAYNAEKWIADAIRSAMAQTWEPKEIIIVDDGSTDRTLAIARQFACDEVRVVEQENEGAAAARNTAFSLSHGDYIQWLDADDLLSSDKIARQLEVLDQISSPRTLLSSSFGHFLYRPSRAQFVPTALWCDLSPTEFLLRKLGQKVSMQTAVWLVSRDLTLAAGPWDISMTSDDDGEYFCRVLLASDGVRFVREARVYYRRVGTAGLSWAIGSDRRLESIWRSMQLHIGHLRSLEESQRVRAACLTYLQNYVIDFYPQRPDIVSQMRQNAEDMGGKLEHPRLSWKYSWIKPLLGWDCARRAQIFLPNLKWAVIRPYDKALSVIETRYAKQ